MRRYLPSRLRPRNTGRRRTSRSVTSITANSATDRAISITNIAVTALLSLAAIHFAHEYNRREDRREAEKLERERVEAKETRERNRRLARAECVNFDVALADRRPFRRNEALRLALARSIEYHVSDCALIGYRVDRREAMLVLARLAEGASDEVRRSVASARRVVREPEPRRVSARQTREASGRLAEGLLSGSAGLGISWNSAFGPFRVDVARALSEKDFAAPEANRLDTVPPPPPP